MNDPIQYIRTSFPNLGDVQPLGRGGQKTVFSATHPTEGDVVLKLIQLSQDDETVERELIAVSSLTTARTPRIYEKGILNSPLGPIRWIREQRVFGQSLRDRITARALAPTELLQLADNGLVSLADAESLRIVHRDVKPDNIMESLDGTFWLLDFGYARHLDLLSLTQTAAPWGKGTLGYCPPEQLRNSKREIDGRCDLYGLAVTIYEAFTRSNPFREGARDQFQITKKVETQSLPRLSFTTGWQADFAELIFCMGQRRREHRPRTVAEALSWLNDIRGSHQI